MADEFVARYQGATHRDLYRQLMAGDPDQVEGLAAHWRSLNDTATQLAATLTKDLGDLGPSWDSDAGREFQHRVALVADFSTALGGDFSTMSGTLTTMAGPLREAKKHAEDPADTDDMDKTLIDGAIGTAIAGPLGTAAGAWFGHKQDEEEQKKAAERMVQLVAGLASTYATRSSAMPVATGEPTGLPGTRSGGRANPAGVGRPTSVGTVGHGGPATYPTSSAPAPTPVSDGPGSGPGADGSDTPGTIDDPTSLLGAGDLTGTGGSTMSGFPGAGTGGGSGLGAGGLAGAAGVIGLAAGGLAGAMMPGAGSLSGTSTSTGAAGARGLFPSGSAESNAGLNGGSGKAAAGLSRRSASGTGRGHEEADETDDRVTWLTEDNMDWSGVSAPPPVLGAVTPTEDEPASEIPEAPATVDEEA
ncbi:MAG: hypothetical protein QOE51_4900 [Actinoplanes sp.]|nr:hypothetical protein [Actinoplanes sp.]